MDALEYFGVGADFTSGDASFLLPFFFPKKRKPSFSFLDFCDLSLALESVINCACTGEARRNSTKNPDMMARKRRILFFQRFINIVTFSNHQ